MVAKYLIILLIFLTSSCGRYGILKENIIIHNNVEIERDFMPYVKKFENNCKKKVDIPIKFLKEIPGKTVGFCLGMYLPKIFKVIYIDKKWWDEWEGYFQYGESLIMHELGHCILNRWHDHSRKRIGVLSIPKSYMSTPVFSPYSNIDYMKELCNN